MPKNAIRLGIGLIVAGLASYFYHHSYILSAIIAGIGYAFLIIGIILWSLEEPGDISFS